MEDLLTPVREEHQFSVSRLQKYLLGSSLVASSGPLTVRQYRAAPLTAEQLVLQLPDPPLQLLHRGHEEPQPTVEVL
ncbi:hypothetical protein CRUP_019965 [Coryphaenoides rupestris]|nr:hypothetical protein CRUP_019965 [Coryphaenoides rupestris]